MTATLPKRIAAQTATSRMALPINARPVAGRWLVSDALGHWAFVDDEACRELRAGRAPRDPVAREALREAGILADGGPDWTRKLRRRIQAVGQGPFLHIVVTTLRCNHTCVYCQASRVPMGAAGHDMSPETADAVVDAILESPAPLLTIEFQGGEPLVRFDIVQRVIERALERGAQRGKDVTFSLVSNLSLMTDERLAYLVDRRVQVCTSLDGPKDLHDAQRHLAGSSSWEHVVGWIRRVNEAYAAAGLDTNLYRVEALPTITRLGLRRAREIVDTYVEVGCRSIFLRAVNPFGFAVPAWRRFGYTPEEFVAFWREAFDYIVSLNLQGVEVLERMAAILLTRILTDAEPNYLDVRNPCGAGIGQLAYHVDGRVFTCDEGRMVAEVGDDAFEVGRAGPGCLRQAVEHPTVRSMILASVLEGQPGCSSCAYRPFCGVCPVLHYVEQGSIAGRPLESAHCRRMMGLFDALFERLATADDATLEVLRRWTTARPRPEFVHPPAPAGASEESVA